MYILLTCSLCHGYIPLTITSERNITMTETTSEKNVHGWTLHMRGMCRGLMINITCERNILGTYGYLQDWDHTDRHYMTLFAEQLTRTFEVLVNINRLPPNSHVNIWNDVNLIYLFLHTWSENCLSLSF